MEYIEIINNQDRLPAALFTIEGEIMNVVVKEPDSFKPGHQLTCLIENNSFHATVLKKNDYNLFLFVPLIEQKIFANRRKSVRCAINQIGLLGNGRFSKEQIKVEVVDISLHGVAIRSPLKLNTLETYILTVPLNGKSLTISIQITNEIMVEGSYRYGCTIQQINDQDSFIIRKYILTTQLSKI